MRAAWRIGISVLVSVSIHSQRTLMVILSFDGYSGNRLVNRPASAHGTGPRAKPFTGHPDIKTIMFDLLFENLQ